MRERVLRTLQVRGVESAPCPPPASLNLSALRRDQGITLREIADDTKISLRFLEAIEEGKFDLLPGGIYNTSYLRQYARAIHVEESELLAYYRSLTAVEA